MNQTIGEEAADLIGTTLDLKPAVKQVVDVIIANRVADQVAEMARRKANVQTG